MATDMLEDTVTSAGDTTFDVPRPGQFTGDLNVQLRTTRTGSQDAGMTPVRPDRPLQGLPLVDEEFLELQYRHGRLRGVPALRRSTPEEIALLKRLSRAFAGGKSVTEIVREDRGSVLP